MKCLSGTINFPINFVKLNACSPFLKTSTIDSFIQNFIKSEKEGSFTVIKKIIGRFAGKSEWEARALGNRSILCDPRFIENINFNFMQISFDTTDFAKKNIPASINQFDFTLRLQVVRKETIKNFYNLIDHFKRLTRIGYLLNTSFNLHVNPNVGTSGHAFYTFVNSRLDVLNIGNYIFYKKNF